MLTRRLFASFGAAAPALALHSLRAYAAYPDRPIHFVVPFAPGGNADIVGRVIGEIVFAGLGQAVVIDNRPGAGGAVGAELAARAARDGYTFMVASNGPMTVNPFVNAKLGYDPLHDFAPVLLTSYVPHVIAVADALGVTTIGQLIEKSRSRPVNLGTSGIGSATHMTLARFQHASGANVSHVPYRGGGSLLPDVVSGTLDGAVTELSTVTELHKAGKLRIIGVASSARSPLVAEVQTFEEAGVRGFLAASYVGLVAPAGTSEELIALLAKTIAGGLGTGSPASEKLMQQGSAIASPDEMTPTGFSRFLAAEYAAMAEAAKIAGIQPN